jgi:hypothetical protein
VAPVRLSTFWEMVVDLFAPDFLILFESGLPEPLYPVVLRDPELAPDVLPAEPVRMPRDERHDRSATPAMSFAFREHASLRTETLGGIIIETKGAQGE